MKTPRSKHLGWCALAMTATALASTPPPVGDFTTVSYNATSKPVDGMKMGSLTIELEATPLGAIREAIGTGTIQYEGDGGESHYWLCYTTSTSQEHARVWIEADGEMGGDNHAITAIAAQLLDKEAATRDCPALPPKFTPLTFTHGLWLGQSTAAAAKALGTAPVSSGPWQFVGFQGKVPANCDGGAGADMLSSIEFKAPADRLTVILVDQVTSC